MLVVRESHYKPNFNHLSFYCNACCQIYYKPTWIHFFLGYYCMILKLYGYYKQISMSYIIFVKWQIQLFLMAIWFSKRLKCGKYSKYDIKNSSKYISKAVKMSNILCTLIKKYDFDWTRNHGWCWYLKIQFEAILLKHLRQLLISG